jgi:hypothetical protein
MLVATAAIASVQLLSPQSILSLNESGAVPKYKLFDTCPWLAGRSAFVQELDLLKGKPRLSSLGVFGIGNGNVFGLIGLGFPQNMLTNIVGPTYEKSENETFFPVWTYLKKGDKHGSVIDLSRTTLYRVRNTPIVVNVEKNHELSMLSVTYAPPGGNTILRNISVKNDSDKRIDSIFLIAEFRSGNDLAQKYRNGHLVQIVNGKRMVVGLVGKGAKADKGQIAMPIGALAPGQEASAVLFVDIQPEITKYNPPDTSPNRVKALLDKTRDAWAGWMKGAISVSSSDPRLGGLFENILTLLKTEQSALTGAVSPMAKYSGSWCRDSFGPVRLLLAAGRFTEVKRILRFYDLATRLRGFNNRYPLDIDLEKAPKNVDWDKMTPQLGDDPNLLILQFYYYFRATGDTGFIREHYGFIRRNLTGQKHTDFRLPFNGDETYQVYFLMMEMKPLKEYYSAESGFEYTVAARAVSEMADAIGETKDAEEFAKLSDSARLKTEEYYWNAERGMYIPGARKDTLAPASAPFADISFNPLWIGYAPAGGKNARSNAINSAKKLLTKEGTVRSSAKTGVYTGLAPGMMLYNLKAVGLTPQADRAYGGLMNRMLSRTGEWAEAYDSQDDWVNYGTAPTVYRPWESGVNAEAILYYITGAEYDRRADTVTLQPHLPPGIDWIVFDNLYVGPHKLLLRLTRRKDESLLIEIENMENQNVKIKLLTEPMPKKAEPAAAASQDEQAGAAGAGGAGIPPAIVMVDGMEVTRIDSAAYGRELVRRMGTLRPGESFHAVGDVFTGKK